MVSTFAIDQPMATLPVWASFLTAPVGLVSTRTQGRFERGGSLPVGRPPRCNRSPSPRCSWFPPWCPKYLSCSPMLPYSMWTLLESRVRINRAASAPAFSRFWSSETSITTLPIIVLRILTALMRPRPDRRCPWPWPTPPRRIGPIYPSTWSLPSMFAVYVGGGSPSHPLRTFLYPRYGAFLGLFAAVPGVILAGCFPAGSFLFLFLLSTACHSMADACPPLDARVFETPSSTLLVVSTGTTSFSFLHTIFGRRSSISWISDRNLSSSILRSIAARCAVSLLLSAVEREASTFRSASFSNSL